MVCAVRFELTTTRFQTEDSDQTELHAEGRQVYHLRRFM